MNKIVFRDDDISYTTCKFQFEKVHKLFEKYKVNHTIGILAKNFKDNVFLFWYIGRHDYFDIQLHGWDHKDYSKLSYEDTYRELKEAKDYLEHIFSNTKHYVKITTFIPPWSRASEVLQKVCIDLDMKISDRVIMPHQYLADSKDSSVVNFHWWEIDLDVLEKMLQKYTKEREQK